MDIRKRCAFALAALSVIGLTGCPKSDAGNSNNSQPTTAGAAQKYTIAVIPKGTENQFWQSVKSGADAACKEEGCEVKWDGPNPENDITAQVNIVSTQINSKVNGIVLAACNKTALVAPVKKAMESNIPVVTIDSGIDSQDPVAYIATDNVKGGEAAADALAKEMGDKGIVGLLIFGKGQVSSDDREKGFLNGLKKHPNIKLISTLESSAAGTAFNSVTNMLAANPNIGGIFASNEPNGVAAAQVLEQKKLAGKIKLVAFDSSDKELESLKSGTIQALIVQDPYQMGFKGVKTVIKAIKKEQGIEKTIDSGLTVVTRDNLDKPDVQKLLHP